MSNKMKVSNELVIRDTDGDQLVLHGFCDVDRMLLVEARDADVSVHSLVQVNLTVDDAIILAEYLVAQVTLYTGKDDA